MPLSPTRTLILGSLLYGVSANAATLYGADYAGANLIPADGDILEGSFTNVGMFVVGAGTEVRVSSGVALEVEALVVEIDGILTADARGDAGGAATPVPKSGADSGQAGGGPGGGGGGGPGACTHGGGGGGGGFGGAGGHGAHHLGEPGIAGPEHGTAGAPYVVGPLGSGAGGGGTSCADDGEAGGFGGGSIFLSADVIDITGTLTANGTNGVSPTGTGGGGGGGSGGSIVLVAQAVTGSGTLSARGGDGADASGGVAGGGGGGGGGRIKIVSQVGTENALVSGGTGGTSQTPNDVSGDGADGTLDVSYNVDDDGDGIASDIDNCVIDSNADQYDDDGDGVGDACDTCPGSDDHTDTDNDTVPDGCDICPAGDDFTDTDNDTVPDACDVCVSGDDLVDTDQDGIADACDLCPGSPDSEDDDLDGAPNDCDNCSSLYNPEQINVDEDPYGAVCDCDDEQATVYAGATEICDGIDNDCDGIPDGPDAEGQTTYHPDFDGDGFGSNLASKSACTLPLNYVEDGTDCDDANTEINSLAEEICDGVDNDCDNQVDEDLADCDLDTGDDSEFTQPCSCTIRPTNPANVLWLAGLLALVFRRRL